LDAEVKEKRQKIIAEIENMPSTHEYDKKPAKPLPNDAHVVINDKGCLLFETNNEV
jgi:hypothetical protein